MNPESGFNPEAEKIGLLEQFEHPEILEINDEKFRVVDISPNETKTEIPTLVVPGFSATPEALKDSILQTANAGRRVISAYAPHGVDRERRPGTTLDLNSEEPDLPEAHLRKFELLMKLIDAKGLEKINIIANSEAAIYVTAAAAMYPEKFKNIVLIEPAGLFGEDKFFGLVQRLVEDMKEEQKQAKSMKKVKYPAPASVGVKSALSDFSASIGEVKAIAKSDISKYLEQIHQSGVGVSIIHAVDDKLFPMEKVQAMTKANMIDGFYSVRGTHNSIYSYEPYGRAAEAALSALEAKHQKS